MSSTRSLRNKLSPATFAEATPPVQDTIELQHSENGATKYSRHDQWVEPSVRSGTASFEDIKGLERVGVLEHMQPLGMAPNSKILQKLKVTGFRPSLSARATPMYSEGVASPAVQPVRDEPSSPMIDPELLLDTPPQHTYYSEQVPGQDPSLHDPNAPMPRSTLNTELGSPRAQAAAVMSPPRGRPAKREMEEMKVYPDDSEFSPSLSGLPRPSRASPRHPTMQEQQKGERFRGYLQNAIAKAARDGKYDVVSGLNKVLAESGRDEVITALENISKYRAGVRLEQFKVFKHYVKKGVRKHRRDSSSNDADVYPLPQPLPPQKKPVAYVSSFHANIKRPAPANSTFTPSNGAKSTTSHTVDNTGSKPKQPPKLTLRPPVSVENMAVNQNALRRSMDGAAGQNSTLNSNFRIPSSPLSSVVSTSLLSDDSDDSVPAPMLDPETQTHNHGPGTWSSKPVGSRQAPIRAASTKAIRMPVMDPQAEQARFETQFHRNLNANNKDAQNKRQKLKDQISLPADYDSEEIQQRRRLYEEDTERGYNYRPVPTINDRPNIEEARQGLEGRPSFKIRSGPPAPYIHPYSLIHSKRTEVSSPATVEFPPINGISRKRDYDEFVRDDTSSRLSSPAPSSSSDVPPLRLKLRLSPAPTTNPRLSVGAPSTRASTPRTAKTTLQSEKRKAPRTMISPKKPKIGASNPGETRAGITRDTTMTNGIESNTEKQENEDECRACGEEGLLLLCEGCPNSFHGECLEPPVQIDDVEGDWYCPECEARRRPGTAKSEVRNFMNPLVDHVVAAYPKIYALPVDIRNYFENVRTGDEGEYIETAAPVANKKGAPRTDNNGAMKPPNYKDVRDKHSNLRLCYKCGLGTGGDREMMPCDYCPNEWHLDCLDPPASVIPKRFGNDGRAPPPWRCPLHIERDLYEHGRAPAAEVGQLGRRPRLRRPKAAMSALQTFARPVPTNNGIIDIQLETEQPDLNVKTVEMSGSVIKLPERMVILDFIKKAKYEYYYDIHYPIAKGFKPQQFHTKHWLPDNPTFRDVSDCEQSEDIRSDHAVELNMEEQARRRLYQKAFIEQQTVHNLVQLSEIPHNGYLAGTADAGVSYLIDQLVADAPENVSQQVLTSEIDQLNLLENLVQRRRNTICAALGIQDGKITQPVLKQIAADKMNGLLGHGNEG